MHRFSLFRLGQMSAVLSLLASAAMPAWAQSRYAFTELHSDSLLGTNAVSQIDGGSANGVYWGSGKGSATGNQYRPLLWTTQSATSTVNMQPAFMGSQFNVYVRGALADGTLWGYAYDNNSDTDHAIVWSTPSAAGAVDIAPTVLGSSVFESFIAGATADGKLFGEGSGRATGNRTHAIVWTAPNAASGVDLHLSALGSGSTSRVTGATADGRFWGTGRAFGPGNRAHALVWTGASAASGADVHPAFLGSLSLSQIAGVTSTGVLYGTGYGSATGGIVHALIWTGNSAASAVDMTPAFVGSNSQSNIYGVAPDGTFWGSASGDATGVYSRPIVWTGNSAASAIDMAPNLIPGLGQSFGIDGATGDGRYWGNGSSSATGYVAHAIFWDSASAASARDITPTVLGANSSALIRGMTSDGRLWGDGFGDATGGPTHALLWTAPQAGSAVDLTPSFLGRNATTLISGTTVSGLLWGSGTGNGTGGLEHALVWTGNTAASAVDLTNFTPGATTSRISFYSEQNKTFAGQVGDHAAVWRIVNGEANGANALPVAEGALTYLIGSGFTQTGGYTRIGTGATLTVTDGNAANGAETFVLAGGTLSGTGTLTGNLLNTGGTVAPGNSPGTLTIDGNYTQDPAGTLTIQIDGNDPGDWDLLHVTGNATLAGTLHIVIGNGFTPTLFTGFDFLLADGNLIGFFDTVNVTGFNNAIDPGLTWEIQRLTPGELGLSGTTNGYRLSFTVVPEPATGVLLLPAGILLLGMLLGRRANRRFSGGDKTVR